MQTFKIQHTELDIFEMTITRSLSIWVKVTGDRTEA